MEGSSSVQQSSVHYTNEVSSVLLDLRNRSWWKRAAASEAAPPGLERRGGGENEGGMETAAKGERTVLE